MKKPTAAAKLLKRLARGPGAITKAELPVFRQLRKLGLVEVSENRGQLSAKGIDLAKRSRWNPAPPAPGSLAGEWHAEISADVLELAAAIREEFGSDFPKPAPGRGYFLVDANSAIHVTEIRVLERWRAYLRDARRHTAKAKIRAVS